MENQWPKVLKLIREQISAANYQAWFSKTSFNSISEGCLLINVHSGFTQETLTKKYLSLITSAVEDIYKERLEIRFKVDTLIPIQKEEDEELELSGFIQPTPRLSDIGLNPKYTLEHFVVGLSNSLAFAAAQAVVQNPGLSYNPLFIYGGTGVGKTHLMHAIGHALLFKKPSLKIIYCSSEKFTNDFVQSIQTKRTGEFRSRYRSIDLFLIDDIQFISGRDSTQEEFFHTFNELHTKNSQIILTSDRPPQEMQKLESRLMSRFQGGLMVDIQQPDFDTRVAILRAKCRERNEMVPEDCLTLIAEVMPTNARELEGKLIQIIQSAKSAGQSLDMDNVRAFLGKIQSAPQKLDHKKVITGINQYFNIKMADITGPKRKKELVLPRQIAMYILYEECKLPYERIGELLGGRDHTTIMHGVEKIHAAVTRDREVQRMLIEVKQALTA